MFTWWAEASIHHGKAEPKTKEFQISLAGARPNGEWNTGVLPDTPLGECGGGRLFNCLKRYTAIMRAPFKMVCLCSTAAVGDGFNFPG